MRLFAAMALGLAALNDNDRLHASAWLLPNLGSKAPARRACRHDGARTVAAAPSQQSWRGSQLQRCAWVRLKGAEVADRDAVSPKRRQSLEAEFSRLAGGKGGRLGVDQVMQAAEISELMTDALLVKSEVEAFVSEVSGGSGSVDVAGFIRVHELIDSLFEEEEGAEEGEAAAGDVKAAAVVPAVESVLPIELEAAEAQFRQLSDAQGRVSLPAFLASEDVSEYMKEGLLTKAEAEALWAEVAGKAMGPLDRGGFLEVYTKMEGLFEDMEEEEEEEEDDIEEVEQAALGQGDDSEYYQQFSALAKAGRVSLQGLRGVSEVSELLADGLLSKAELAEIWANVVGGAGKEADFRAFKAVMREMDSMFEEAEEEEEEEEEAPAPVASAELKPQLLSLLSSAEGAGLDENEAVDGRAIELANAMARDLQGNLAADDELDLDVLEDAVIGDWELFYTTSRTMRYNRGLCGLGRTLPQAEFVSLTHSLTLNGYAYDMVYREKLRTLGRELDVVVEAAWELKDLTSVMDGSECLTLDVALQQIKYGFITERLETGWKGVRVLNRCQVLYLDKDLRIMKGQSADSFFFFRRIGDGSGAKLDPTPPPQQ